MKQMSKQRVALGLSGGVDSAVSAALLLEQGYEVMAVFLECWRGTGCRVEEDRKDALDIALHLKIPFEVLDFKQAYKQKVVDYFYQEYEAGRTPNPDVMCNREIKFGLFYDWAINRNNFDFMATGHYARVGRVRSSELGVQGKKEEEFPRTPNPYDGAELNSAPQVQITSSHNSSNLALFRGIDEKKDQSYFLCQLRQEQLAHILFPIGHLTKTQVRAEAKKRGLPVAAKPDSQGICFIGEVSTTSFLKELGMEEEEGNIVVPHYATTTSRKLPIRPFRDSVASRGDRRDVKILSRQSKDGVEYVEIGKHRGAWFYTVGQRIGLQTSDVRRQISERHKRVYTQNMVNAGLDPSNLPPLYVIEKDVEHNRLLVGTREMLFRDRFEIEQVHWISGEYGARIMSQTETNLDVRIRHLGELLPAKLMLHDSHFMIHLSKPAFGVAPGQIATFYAGEVCLGGGVIA